MLSVTPAPDSLAVPAMTGAPFYLAKWLTQTSVSVPWSSADVTKEELRTASENEFWEDIFEGYESKEKNVHEKKDLTTNYVLVKEEFFEGKRSG